MEWLIAIVGIASLIGGLFMSSQQMEDEKETKQYNQELNQKIMDREDNAWQRAVEDRSKAGLSIAGLSQGAGAGGTVSQLQAPQGAGMMANLLQNISGQSFGLAQSSYEGRKARELQKENFLSELELKKEQIENDKLNAMYQRMATLADINLRYKANSREQSIYDHNMKIATGEYTDPKKRVFGSQPSELERLVTSLYNYVSGNPSNNPYDSAKNAANTVIDNASDIESVLSSDNGLTGYTKDNLSKPLLEFLNNFPNVTIKNVETDGKDYYMVYNDHSMGVASTYKKQKISKHDYDLLYKEFEKKRKNN